MRIVPHQPPSRPATAPVGIGLRAPHVDAIAASRPAEIGFLEVHAENYMAPAAARGGAAAALDHLLDLRRDYAVSLHGVALSLGSADGLDRDHLARFRALIDLLEPALVSEHLSWSAVGGTYLNDLLPFPYTEASLDLFCRNVDEAQSALGRRLLIENPSSYIRFAESDIPEAEFLAETARRTGCGILCDVNNIHVVARNFGLDPIAYLDALPPAAVGEIHLAGHHRAADVDILIDDHGARVAEAVWELYDEALRRFGLVPALVEWDADLPALEILLGEARRAAAQGAAHVLTGRNDESA
jgi:uncharacterized protein (UPF0276 family)